MSRIHEALRRATNEPVANTSDEREDVFAPAWPVEPAENTATSAEPMRHLPAETRFVGESHPAVRGFSAEWRERLATGAERNGVLVEQFRRLAATLHHAQAAHDIHLIMVTSAAASDGKTLTAVNLALVLSESYRKRVLLIDADLRRPSIGDVTDLTGSSGLGEVLRAPTEQKLGLVQLTPTLTVLPAGRPDPDPLAGLTSQRMRRILDEAAARFDWVILDAPPVGPLADGSVLAQMVDGTLFVVRAAQTQLPVVQKAIEAVGRERIIGVVLNGVERMPTEHYERYYTDPADR